MLPKYPHLRKTTSLAKFILAKLYYIAPAMTNATAGTVPTVAKDKPFSCRMLDNSNAAGTRLFFEKW
jgi:hypothetical protein